MILFKNSLYLLWSIGISAIALAGTTSHDCSYVNLSDPGGSMEPLVRAMPIALQNGGSCAYHTATELYDAWRIQQDRSFSGQFSSAFEINYRMKNARHEKDLTAGVIFNILKTLLKEGSCPNLAYDPASGEDLDERAYHQLQNRFAQLRQTPLAAIESLNAETMLELDPDLNNRVSTLLESIRTDEQFKRYANRLNPNPNLDAVYSSILANDFISFVREVVPPSCAENERLRSSKKDRLTYLQLGPEHTDPQALLNLIHDELDKGSYDALPVGVGYCSRVLTQGTHFNEMDNPDGSLCGAHASVILGRRKNPQSGTCQVLLRNTWGNIDCTRKAWECVPNKSHVWIDEDIFKNSLFSITKIDKK